MKLVLRWFPYGDDSVKLKQIKQIPGVSGVATHLTRIPVGEIWTDEEINLVKDEINSYGLEMEVIESLNIHEDIKKGLPSRDMLIDNYIESMKNLSKAGVKFHILSIFRKLNVANRTEAVAIAMRKHLLKM